MTKWKGKKINKISKEIKNDKLLIKELVIVLFIIIIICCSILYVYNNQKHTISFDSKGGNTIITRKISHNKKLTKCETPVKDGYEFLGWYLDGELFECNQKITEDIELEARWEKIIEKGIDTIVFNYSNIELKPNVQVKLVPIVSPTDVNGQLYWLSSNDDVVEVDDTGVITTKKNGTATITVSSENGIKAEQMVVVNEQMISVNRVILHDTELFLTEGEIKQLTYDIEPVNASNKNVKWMSDNTSVLTVNQNGEISAKTKGKATVILITMDSDITVKCEVTVTQD